MSVNNLIKIIGANVGEYYNLDERIQAIEELGKIESVDALNYLLLLWANDGPIKSCSSPAGGPEGASFNYHKVFPPDFPNAEKSLGLKLGQDMFEYKGYQLHNDTCVLHYRRALCAGNMVDAEKKLRLFYDKKGYKNRALQIHHEFLAMKPENREKEYPLYHELYQMRELETREMMKKSGNAFLTLDTALINASKRLAATRNAEVIDRLKAMCEERELFSFPPGSFKKKDAINLDYQVISIEALAETNSPSVLEYLSNLAKFESYNTDPLFVKFAHAKPFLEKALVDGFMKTIKFEQNPDNTKGVFFDNAYIVLCEAIAKLKGTTLKNQLMLH